MAATAGTALAFVLCLAFGRFTEAVIFAAVLTTLGAKWTKTREAAFYAFLTAIALSAMVTTRGAWAALIPATAIYASRSAFSSRADGSSGKAWIIIVPVAVLALRVHDRDLIAAILSSLALIAPTVAFRRSSGIPCKRWIVFAEVSMLCIVLISVPMLMLGVNRGRASGKTVILRGGKWARTETRLNSESNINIGSMYSYSEVYRLLDASSVKIEELNKGISEAWLITPTIPLSPAELVDIYNWVQEGGSLFIVTDHTDLYGHARVVNRILSGMNLQTSLSAFFPWARSQAAAFTLGPDIHLKTANVQFGRFLWPLISARWIDEDVDYSARNFFGPGRASLTDRYGSRVIAGRRSFGFGTVTLFGDSTVLANFAVYQPDSIALLRKLRHMGFFFRLVPIVWVWLVLAVIWGLSLGRRTLLEWTPVIALWALMDFGVLSLSWPAYAWWSGDKRMLMEWQAPSESVSTAFALVPLSGRRARWTDDPGPGMHGFWVSKAAPPSEGWRWVDLSPAATEREQYDRRLDKLLLLVNPFNPRMWPSAWETTHIRVGDVWTNSALGDWWVDRGVGEAKRRRIDAWIRWLKGEAAPAFPRAFKPSESTIKMYEFKSTRNALTPMMLPELKVVKGQQIYLGRGVSADAVEFEGKMALLGGKPYVEGWDAPDSWVLIPMRK
jgi:hypothetical protein